MANIQEYADIVMTVISLLAGTIGLIVGIVLRVKTLKTAKTSAERTEVINQIKADVFGLINTAEHLFSDIPKSGASKLLYVLNHVKEICGASNVEYDQSYWEEFINGVVKQSNEIQNSKAFESEKTSIIELVKSEIPYFIEDANKLFEVIPDSKPYKIEYILKLIEVSCDKHNINVFLEFDWRAYVGNLLISEEVA